MIDIESNTIINIISAIIMAGSIVVFIITNLWNNKKANERLVILLIIAHVVLFVSMAIINVILGVINDLLEYLEGNDKWVL